MQGKPDRLAPSGIAYREVRRWLEGARMLSCGNGDDGIWTCAIQLGMVAGMDRMEPRRAAKVGPPAAWKVTTEHRLSGETSVIRGQGVRIGIARYADAMTAAIGKWHPAATAARQRHHQGLDLGKERRMFSRIDSRPSPVTGCGSRNILRSLVAIAFRCSAREARPAHRQRRRDFSGWRGGIGITFGTPSRDIADVTEMGYELVWGGEDPRASRRSASRSFVTGTASWRPR